MKTDDIVSLIVANISMHGERRGAHGGLWHA